MKRSIKLAGLIAAALFATTPLVENIAGLNNNVVQATGGQPTPGATKLVLGLKKPKLVFPAPSDKLYAWGYYTERENEIINDITINHGKINDANFSFYEKGKNGKVRWEHPIEPDSKTPAAGTEGVVIVSSIDVDGLKLSTNYTFLSKADDSGELVWSDHATDQWNKEIIQEDGPLPAIKIPYVIGGKKTNRTSSSGNKINAHVYVAAKRNRRVRTYTSHGKFSHHYVYGHRTYRVNKRKHINNHGTCYKIYGKNQWIPSKYISRKF